MNRSSSHRPLLSVSLALGAAAASAVAAQNVIPNAEFNENIVPWVSDFSTAVWDSGDSRGCPGSGQLEVPCVFSDALVNDTCLPYSADTARLAFDLKASADVPGSETFGFSVEMFFDTGCQTSIFGFPIFAGFDSNNITATYQTFESTLGLNTSTQSIKVLFVLSENNCEEGMVFFLDTLYYGEAHRIVAHDFENEDICPFTQNP